MQCAQQTFCSSMQGWQPCQLVRQQGANGKPCQGHLGLGNPMIPTIFNGKACTCHGCWATSGKYVPQAMQQELQECCLLSDVDICKIKNLCSKEWGTATDFNNDWLDLWLPCSLKKCTLARQGYSGWTWFEPGGASISQQLQHQLQMDSSVDAAVRLRLASWPAGSNEWYLWDHQGSGLLLGHLAWAIRSKQSGLVSCSHSSCMGRNHLVVGTFHLLCHQARWNWLNHQREDLPIEASPGLGDKTLSSLMDSSVLESVASVWDWLNLWNYGQWWQVPWTSLHLLMANWGVWWVRVRIASLSLAHNLQCFALNILTHVMGSPFQRMLTSMQMWFLTSFLVFRAEYCGWSGLWMSWFDLWVMAHGLCQHACECCSFLCACVLGPMFVGTVFWHSSFMLTNQNEHILSLDCICHKVPWCFQQDLWTKFCHACINLFKPKCRHYFLMLVQAMGHLPHTVFWMWSEGFDHNLDVHDAMNLSNQPIDLFAGCELFKANPRGKQLKSQNLNHLINETETSSQKTWSTGSQATETHISAVFIVCPLQHPSCQLLILFLLLTASCAAPHAWKSLTLTMRQTALWCLSAMMMWDQLRVPVIRVRVCVISPTFVGSSEICCGNHLNNLWWFCPRQKCDSGKSEKQQTELAISGLSKPHGHVNMAESPSLLTRFKVWLRGQSMESSSKKSVRLPMFDGMHENFQVWWMQFCAFAMVHKFSAALMSGGEADSPQKESDIIDMSADVGKSQAAAKKCNADCNCWLHDGLCKWGIDGLDEQSQNSWLARRAGTFGGKQIEKEVSTGWHDFACWAVTDAEWSVMRQGRPSNFVWWRWLPLQLFNADQHLSQHGCAICFLFQLSRRQEQFSCSNPIGLENAHNPQPPINSSFQPSSVGSDVVVGPVESPCWSVIRVRVCMTSPTFVGSNEIGCGNCLDDLQFCQDENVTWTCKQTELTILQHFNFGTMWTMQHMNTLESPSLLTCFKAWLRGWSMESLSEKSVQLPTFDGMHKNFQAWWMWFVAHATVCNFSAVSASGGEVDSLQKESDIIDLIAMLESCKWQWRGTMWLWLPISWWPLWARHWWAWWTKPKQVTGPVGWCIWSSSDWKKFQPMDTISCVKSWQMLNEASMKSETDSATLFEQLSNVENEHDADMRKIDEEDKIAVILTVAPKEHQAVSTIEQRSKGATLPMSDLEEAMYQHWQQIKKHCEDEEENDDEHDEKIKDANHCLNLDLNSEVRKGNENDNNALNDGNNEEDDKDSDDDEKEEARMTTGSRQKVHVPMRLIEEIGMMAFDWKIMCAEAEMKHDVTMHAFWNGKIERGELACAGTDFVNSKELHMMKCDNNSNLFAKNLDGPAFEKHTAVHCGADECLKHVDSDSQGKGVSSNVVGPVESPCWPVIRVRVCVTSLTFVGSNEIGCGNHLDDLWFCQDKNMTQVWEQTELMILQHCNFQDNVNHAVHRHAAGVSKPSDIVTMMRCHLWSIQGVSATAINKLSLLLSRTPVGERKSRREGLCVLFNCCMHGSPLQALQVRKISASRPFCCIHWCSCIVFGLTAVSWSVLATFAAENKAAKIPWWHRGVCRDCVELTQAQAEQVGHCMKSMQCQLPVKCWKMHCYLMWPILQFWPQHGLPVIPLHLVLLSLQKHSFILWPCNHEENGGVINAMKSLCSD